MPDPVIVELAVNGAESSTMSAPSMRRRYGAGGWIWQTLTLGAGPYDGVDLMLKHGLLARGSVHLSDLQVDAGVFH